MARYAVLLMHMPLFYAVKRQSTEPRNTQLELTLRACWENPYPDKRSLSRPAPESSGAGHLL